MFKHFIFKPDQGVISCVRSLFFLRVSLLFLVFYCLSDTIRFDAARPSPVGCPIILSISLSCLQALKQFPTGVYANKRKNV